MKYYVIYVKYNEVQSFDILNDPTQALAYGEAFCHANGLKRPFFEGEHSKLTAKGDNWTVSIIAREE